MKREEPSKKKSLKKKMKKDEKKIKKSKNVYKKEDKKIQSLNSVSDSNSSISTFEKLVKRIRDKNNIKSYPEIDDIPK